MKYVLVAQFPEPVMSYDKVMDLEDVFINKLEGIAEIDGHDIGSGEINYFIFTNNVTEVCEKILPLLTDELKGVVKVAYRDAEGEDYSVLYPSDLASFQVS